MSITVIAKAISIAITVIPTAVVAYAMAKAAVMELSEKRIFRAVKNYISRTKKVWFKGGKDEKKRNGVS